MLDLLINYSITLVRFYFVKRFMTIFFGFSFQNRGKEKIVYVLSVVLLGTVHTIFSSALINLVCNLLLFYFIASLYEDNKKTKILVIILVYGINAICDVLSAFSFNQYVYREGYKEITPVVTVFFIGISEIIIEKYLIKKRSKKCIPLYWERIIFVPSISIALLISLVISNLNNRVALIYISVSLLLINLLIFYLYDALADAYMQLEERNLLERRAESYSNQLKVFSQSQERIRGLYHDLKHHLGEILILAEGQNKEKIAEYIQSMQIFIENPLEYSKSGNREIDSLLNYLLKQAEEKLNLVEYKMNVPKELKIDIFDFNIIVGNLIENGIQAAQVSDKKWLWIFIEYEKGLLFIWIKNSYRYHPIKKGDKYISLKRGGEEYGLGLQNVKSVMERYHGSMEIEDKNEIFEVKLILYL